MKLISVQSRGNRTAWVFFKDVFWRKKKYMVWKKFIYKTNDGRAVVRSNNSSHAYWERSALLSAENWLRGATT